MKTNCSQPKPKEGSVLLVTMCVLSVGLIALAGYFMIVQDENNSVSRSQAWNAIISVSEAGIEEGLALVNQGYPSVIQNSWAWTNSTGSWNTTNGVYTLSRTVYGSASYSVMIDTSTGVPVITSTGTVPYTPMPWAFSANRGPMMGAATLPFLAAGTSGGSTSGSSTTTSSTLGRRISVQTVLSPLFSAAMVAKSNITFKGNGVTVDSFDSSNPLYSTGGIYDPNKRKAGGSIGTDSVIASSISVQNANVYGKAMTGPGSQASAVNVGSQGAVGDLAWQAANSKGVEPGFWSGDFNVNIPDVPTPTASASLPAASNGVIYVTSGAYMASSDPGKPININGPVTLWVTTSFSPNITFNSNNPNASLVLYVGAATGASTSLSLGGNGGLNYPGYARNLQVYGLPSLTSISFQGNAGFSGTIYAPEATVSGGGGGNNTLDTSGAIIANTINANGHWNYHYDESLGTTNGPSRGWIPKNWTEVKYP